MEKKVEQELNEISLVDEDVLSPDCDIDAEEFEWVGQDEEKMQAIGRPSVSFWKDAFNRIRKDKVAMTIFIFLIVLFLITSLILLITLKKLKVGKVKETYKKIILSSCGVTFLSYIIGTLILLLTQFLSRISWIRTNLAEPLIESPFANIYTILYTIFAFLIATYFIFYLNRKITMKAIRLSNKKETKIALILTIFTAPYLFFVPMNVQPKVEPKEIQS